MSDADDSQTPATVPTETAAIGADKAPGAAERPSHGRETDAGDQQEPEVGGPQGPEPTRFGDWERKGRCIDF